MIENRVYDYLLVGHGLAGTLFAHFLRKRTQNFLVVDSEKNTASFAAAGIINPVTGRNFVKSWLIDDLIPVAVETYREISMVIGENILNEIDIIRTIKSIREENDWNLRTQNEAYHSYVQSVFNSPELDAMFQQNAKYAKTKICYQIDLRNMILKYRAILKSNKQYLCATIDTSDLIKENDFWLLNGIKAKSIVFCEGHLGEQNQMFKNISFKTSKGYSIEYETDLDLNINYKDDFYITPLKNNTFWTGTGNEWNAKDSIVDEEIVKALKLKIENSIKKPINILRKNAGIRPTMLKRRPVIGQIPTHPNLYIFNGFGTKGASLAPYMAQLMMAEMFDGHTIPSELKVSYTDALYKNK